MMPLTVQPEHWLWMNATWGKLNLSLNIHTVFHAQQLLQKSEYLQQVFTVPHQQLEETKSSCKVDSTCAR